KRTGRVGWLAAKAAAAVPTARVHDLRHTAASLWLGVGADPKVVQRVMGHATAAMTMDLYGHMVDASLWQAARLVGGTTGHLSHPRQAFEQTAGRGRVRKTLRSWAFSVEPPIGIEPMTYALRGGFRPSTTVQWVTPALLARLLVPPTSKVMQSCC